LATGGGTKGGGGVTKGDGPERGQSGRKVG
jgi:hypothetical protein